jgi:predicted nucleic acid-binding protein
VPILVDTGVLIAAIDRSDVDDADAAALLEIYAGQLLVPSI